MSAGTTSWLIWPPRSDWTGKKSFVPSSEEEFLPAVRADQKLAAQLGIRGVPFFVIGGKFGISGAQPPEVFTKALAQYEAERGDGSLA